MKKSLTLFATSALAVTVLNGCAPESRRQEPATIDAVEMIQGTGTVSAADEQFAQKAAQGGIAEVEMARLAQRKTQNEEVRRYADQLLTEHTQANQDLMQAAQSARVRLPQAPSEQQQNLLQELSQLSGSQFDQRFMEVQVQEHQKDIDLYIEQAEKWHNSAIKSYARNTFPFLQQHLDWAQAIRTEQRAMK